MLSRRDLQPENLKRVVGAIVTGLFIGTTVGLGIVSTLATRRVAALVITPFPTATEMPAILPTSIPTAISLSTPTPIVTSTPTPHATTTNKPRPNPIQTSQSTPSLGRLVEHFLFGRPLALDSPAPAPNPVYLYGTTEQGQFEVHHGVDFDRNPIGVPILAIGDGTIVTAGDDRKPLCGDKGQTACGRVLNFYGLITVIQLDQPFRGQTLFAQYGHMDRIAVRLGQRVKRDDVIGTVGMTGIALGPHVHFEIRVGTNDYASTRNPMLWIPPLPGRGVLAGRYADQAGNPMRGQVIDIYRAQEPEKFYRETETYSADDQPDVNSDDELGENFVMSDLPAGDYVLRVPGKPFTARVTVTESGLVFADLVD